jgi:DNA (cytosine-5)-methyltransferase 1
VKNYYSLAETADLLSVSKQTLRRWDDNGTLTPIRMHNNYRAYSPDVLDEYINSNNNIVVMVNGTYYNCAI